jgi:hypothetical protein
VLRRSAAAAAAALVPLLTVASCALAPPVQAAATSLVGGAGWGGVTTLPLYPCTSGCTVNFSGYFAGSITALDASGIPTYTAVWPGTTSTLQANLQAGSITYSEDCGSIPFAPPLTGSATGPFVVSGGVLEQGGAVVGTAQLRGTFTWSRTGAVVLVTLSAVVLMNGGGTVVATAQSAGEGVALFGPPAEQPAALPLPPNCAHEVPVTVAVVGTYAQPT